MGRESGSGLAGSFWLRVSPERGLKLLGGELQPHGAGESTSRLAHLAIGRSQFLPECWLDTSVLHHIGLSVGCLTVFVTWQRASLTTEDPRESTIKHSRQKVQSFYNLISEKTWHDFCRYASGHKDPPRRAVGRGYTGVWLAGGEDPWAPFCRLTTSSTVTLWDFS